jgi:hypothetical protein
MSAPFSEFGPFAVGEICRIVRCDTYPELVWHEVMITEPCQRLIETKTGEFYDGYRTDLAYKNSRVCPPESYLRRRRPPALDTGERMFMQQLHDLADRLRQGVPA